MIKHGYLSMDNANVLVSVQNKDQQKADALRSVVVSDINDALANYNVTVTVYNQTITDTKEDLAAFTKQNGISYGKAVFLHNLVQKMPTTTMEEMASMSIQELSQMVKRNKIDIRDIVYYEYDDTITENIADTIDNINEMNYNTMIADISGVNYISEAKAKEIALQHAGVSANETQILFVKQDWDDGVPVYEVEFYQGNKEYDYQIHAVDGSILDFDYDAEQKIPQTQTLASQQNQYIGETKAKQIALSKAGVSANDVSGMIVKFDYDDGYAVYEIEFRQGATEYECDVDAINDNVLKFEMD